MDASEAATMMETAEITQRVGVTTKLGYRPALDGVRALAVGLVVGNHTGLAIFGGGEDGVVIFFVLSGFLITALMIEEWDKLGRLRIGRFYARRFIRLVPAVAFVVIVAMVLARWIAPASDRQYLYLEGVLAFFYLTNLHGAFFGGIPDHVVNYFGHTWSLAIEEHFYLIWPWLFTTLLLATRRATTVARMLVIAAAAVLALRLAVDLAGHPDLMLFSPLHFDGFALGAALAFVFHNDAWPRLRRLLSSPIAGLVGVALILLDTAVGIRLHEIRGAVFITYVSVLSVVVIGNLAWAPAGPVARFFSRPTLVYFGKLSYSIYLWHLPVFVFVTEDRFPSTPPIALKVAEFSATFALAATSYHLIERRFVSLRSRFRTV